MHKFNLHRLACLLALYLLASLIHFAHNAEFLELYPGLPESWTRSGVYVAWIGLTVIGISGWLLTRKGYAAAGLTLVVCYALLGMDSLAHYVVAPLSAHTFMMNLTILLEVAAAGLVLIEASRLMTKHVLGASTIKESA